MPFLARDAYCKGGEMSEFGKKDDRLSVSPLAASR
jgi:hypothetical protein